MEDQYKIKPEQTDGLAELDKVNVFTQINKGVPGVAPEDLATVSQLNEGGVPTSRTITAGNGLTGGGDLSVNRTITMGAPSTLTGATTNGVTATSHTHAVNISKADVGLGNADNTSDVNKPISTATQSALNLKANTASLGAAAFSNDYEDLDNKPTTLNITYGSWSPVITSSGTDPTFTYVRQIGVWRRIGDLIFFELQITYSALLTGGSGNIRIPLPFPRDLDEVEDQVVGAVSIGGINAIDVSARQIFGYYLNVASAISFTDEVSAAFVTGDLNSSGSIVISGSYRASS